MALSREKGGGALTIFTTEIRNMWSVTLHAFLIIYILQAPLACKVHSVLTHVRCIKFLAHKKQKIPNNI
jgi:hypothetical protein